LVAAAKAEPGNAAVRTEFTKVEGLITEATKKAKAKGTPISLPTRAPEPSGSPHRRRVPIGIVNDEAPGEEDAKSKTLKPKAAPTVALKSILKNASPSPSDQPVTLPVVSKSDSFLTPVSTRPISSKSPLQKEPARISAASTASTQHPPTSSPNKSLISSSTPAITAPKPPLISPPPSKGTEEPSLTFPLQPDSTPPSLLDFLQKWSNARTDADKASVLFTVPPASIPSLFGPTLESPLLGAMLGALSWALASTPNLPAADVPQRTVACMTALAQVPRFSTLVLFLDATEKRYAKEVWDGLEQSGVDIGLGEREKWKC
ncbi:unnamed protein product, partial [Rhizoctonia solani]